MSNGLSLPFAGAISNNQQAAFSVSNTGDPKLSRRPIVVAVEGSAPKGTAVSGTSQESTGVLGESQTGVGVSGSSNSGEGVFGQGRNGVHGQSASPTDSGVWGENTGSGYGVSGVTHSSFEPGPNVVAAVWGMNNGSGAGVKGTSVGGDGVVGFSGAKDHAGVSAVGSGVGLWAGGTPAGHFEGGVEINGSLTILSVGDVILSDFAEDFDTGDPKVEPGTVMAIAQDGTLRPSNQAYDKRVAGVVSGAGDCRPAIVLDKQGHTSKRRPIALVGKVFCKVDARDGAIEIGDL